MKRLIYIIMGFFLLAVAITACKEDDETVLSSNCYIKNFTLGQLKREVHYTDSTGKDTFNMISFSGAYYPLHINQVEQTILLSSPLPTGTHLEAVLASVTFEGALFYRAWETPEDTTWTAFSSSDSIDFRAPLRFRVYSTDGTSFRDYYFRLDCRTTEANTYAWEQVSDSCCPSNDERRLLTWDGKLFLLTRDAETGQCNWQWSAATGQTPLGKTWTPATGSQSLNAAPQTLSLFRDKLWVSSTDGRELWTLDKDNQFQLHHTFDAASGIDSLMLFAGSELSLYGIGTTDDGQRAIFQSSDGQIWVPMMTDDDMSRFPAAPVALSYEQRNGNSRVLVAGQTADGSETCEVWSLLEGADEPWTYFTPSADNAFRLPVLAELNILSYNNLLIALGGITADGSYLTLNRSFVSHDNGITWKTGGDLNVPTQLKKTDKHVSATAWDGYIWVCAGKELWRARLNNYGETE